MDVTHGGSFIPDPTPTGGPSVTQLSLADGAGVSWSITRKAGITVATPSVVTASLPGSEIGYDQITASVSITGTTSAAPTTIISGSAHIFDGSPVLLDFSAMAIVTPNAAGVSLNIGLYEGSTLITILTFAVPTASANMWVPFRSGFRFTPSAGSHTYSIKGWAASGSGADISAGTGTAGSAAPAYLRFTKV